MGAMVGYWTDKSFAEPQIEKEMKTYCPKCSEKIENEMNTEKVIQAQGFQSLVPKENMDQKILHRISIRIAGEETATNRSLSESLREKILSEILKLASTAFEDKLYDTNEAGKGFRPGYVSFALAPTSWRNKGLIGGILIRGQYDPSIKSNSPEPNTPEQKKWVEEGGNKGLEDNPAVIISLEAGYYNKKQGGTFNKDQNLGDVIFEINEMEEITSFEFEDIGKVVENLNKIIDSVLKDPPDNAIGARHEMRRDPYRTLPAFLQYLLNEGRNEFRTNEVNEVVRNTNRTREQVIEYLRVRGFTFVG